MPVIRLPNGDIVEVDEATAAQHAQKTQKAGDLPPAPPGGGGSANPLEEKTRPVTQAERQRVGDMGGNMAAGKKSAAPAADDGKTQVFRRNKPEATGADTAPVSSAEQVAESDQMDDPVVGWLVVVGGPGKGAVLNIGYGQNWLGSAEGQRVRLNFGDKMISREQHCQITYDPRARSFSLAPGMGSGLVYLQSDDGQAQLVQTPVSLNANTHIEIGETVVRFVPLCGENFDWQDDNA